MFAATKERSTAIRLQRGLGYGSAFDRSTPDAGSASPAAADRSWRTRSVIALILAGTYIYRDFGTPGILVDQSSCCGASGQTTEVSTVDGAWDLRWTSRFTSETKPAVWLR